MAVNLREEEAYLEGLTEALKVYIGKLGPCMGLLCCIAGGEADVWEMVKMRGEK